MKKILGLLICTMLMITPVYAQTTTNGNSDGTTSGNSDATTNGTDNAVNVTLAKEKRVLIKTQNQELAQLRAELRTKIAEQKTEMNQYREKGELTEDERTEVKEMIKNLKSVQVKLGEAYQNITKAMSRYKGDKSANKLTGLDLVIASQQERIALLKAAIAEL